MSKPLSVNIVIPTYNRADLIGPSIEAALNQDYQDFKVTVVDDGSQDGTWQVCEKFARHENFQAIRLKKNVGTAQAKNAAIALTNFDAITFHDSDDIPHPNKVRLQAEAMMSCRPIADAMMDWPMIGREVGTSMQTDVVVGAYDFFKQDGRTFRIANRISIVDDFFPHLQYPSQVEGDWCLINAGLFRKEIFCEYGGYLDSIEEDRELRNRLLGYGRIFYFVEEPLLKKYEMPDSLTVASQTSFQSLKRRQDRTIVQQRKQEILKKFAGTIDSIDQKTPIDLREIVIADLIRPENFKINNAIPTKGFYRRAEQLDKVS